MKKLKTYNIGKNTTFDLTKLCQDLEKGTYTIKTQAVSVNGKKSPESAGITYKVDPLNPLGLPPFTIRCKFKQGVTPEPCHEEITWDNVVCIDETENVLDITKNSEDWSSLFEYQQDLLEVLGANSTGVTNMLDMFIDCSYLERVELFDTSSVTNMCGMFDTCGSLISVPLFDTHLVESMSYMFAGCYELTEIPLFDTSSVKNVDWMFYHPEMDVACENVQHGALALYKLLATRESEIWGHEQTFTRCGILTETGRAELDQIPLDWGGNAE